MLYVTSFANIDDIVSSAFRKCNPILAARPSLVLPNNIGDGLVQRVRFHDCHPRRAVHTADDRRVIARREISDNR